MISSSARASLVRFGTRRLLGSHWHFAVPLAGVGAVLGDAAFGVLLCTLVALRYYRFTEGCDAPNEGVLREFSRRCSREVYLILYLALVLQLFSRMLSVSWGGSEVMLGWSAAFQAAPQNMIMQCGEEFRGQLAGGVMALLLIRVLFAQNRPPQPRPVDRR